MENGKLHFLDGNNEWVSIRILANVGFVVISLAQLRLLTTLHCWHTSSFLLRQLSRFRPLEISQLASLSSLYQSPSRAKPFRTEATLSV